MRVRNVHQRLLPASAAEVGALIDSLGSPEDRLWPGDLWPPLHLDAPLPTATRSGHGPVRYRVERYEPGRSVSFRFTRPAGFDGSHEFFLEPSADGAGTWLRHEIRMELRGGARISWPLVFRPLHDALLEDALDRAERSLGRTPRPSRWSPWVRLLRGLLGRRRSGRRSAR